MCYVVDPPADTDDLTDGGKQGGEEEGEQGWTWFSDRSVGRVPREEVAAAEPSIVFFTRTGATDGMASLFTQEEGEGAAGRAVRSGEPALCVGGCGFFGTAAKKGYCTSCFTKSTV